MKKIDDDSVKKYEKKCKIIFIIVCLLFALVSTFLYALSMSSLEEAETSEIYHSQEVKRVQTKPFPNLPLQSISTLEQGDIFLTNFGYVFNVKYQNGNDFTSLLDLIYSKVSDYVSTNNLGSVPTFVPFYHTLPYSYGYGNYVYNYDYSVPGIGYLDDYSIANVNIGLVDCDVGAIYNGWGFSNQFLFSYSSVSDNDDYDFTYRLVGIYTIHSFNYDKLLVFNSSNPIFDDYFWDFLLTYYGIGCYKLSAPEDPDALEKAYQTGYDNGYFVGYDEGYDLGYDEGYVVGDEEHLTTNSFKTLFNLILNAPYNIFKGMLNFEVFGVNLFGFLSFILTTFLILGIISLVRKK